MTESIIDRAKALEERLEDCDAPAIASSLAAMRELYEHTPTELRQTALAAGCVFAEAALEQFKSKRAPWAEDGDVHVEHRSFAPGPQTEWLVAHIRKAELEAIVQRRALLAPLVAAVRGAR